MWTLPERRRVQKQNGDVAVGDLLKARDEGQDGRLLLGEHIKQMARR